MGIFSWIGDLLGGTKRSSSDTKTASTTTRDPYAPTVGPISDFLTNTQNLYGTNMQMFSPMEQQGYSMLSDVAGGGPSDFFRSSEKMLQDTAEGKYLTPETNPYLADIAKRVSGIAGANTASTFAGKGRTGGGLAAYYGGKAVGDSLTDMYGGAYDAERGRQMNAAGSAPAFEKARFDAPQAMISAGQNISARPFDLNQQYGGILQGIAGVGGTSHTTGTTNTTGSVTDPQSGLIGKIANSFTNKLFPG